MTFDQLDLRWTLALLGFMTDVRHRTRVHKVSELLQYVGPD